MARIKLFRKLIFFHYLIIFIICLLSLLGVITLNEKSKRIENTKARQYFSEVQNEILRNNIPNIDGVRYATISLEGVILYSSISYYEENKIVELKTLAGLNGTIADKKVYFIFPFLENNIQIGTLVLLIDVNLVETDYPIFLEMTFILSCLISVAFIAYLIKLINVNLKNPIYTLNKISKNMVNGNFDEKLVYDYIDEVGELCHNIEQLRDDLLSSKIRENELRKNEKFLLACISHDLKTPLAIISGTAESLRDQMISKEEATKRILEKVEGLNKLINDILEQTKTELNEFSIVKEECYAKTFFEKELQDLKSEADKKQLSFKIHPCPNCLINIDKQRIIQVLQNIISNAIKFTQANGNIVVKFEIKNNFLIISIKDTGTGISSSDLPFIFNKFYRGEKARTTNTFGSGLGLSISKYIVEKHGGSIECNTIFSKGTDIRFSLPLN